MSLMRSSPEQRRWLSAELCCRLWCCHCSVPGRFPSFKPSCSFHVAFDLEVEWSEKNLTQDCVPESILSQRLCERTVLSSVPWDLEVFMVPSALHDVTVVGGWQAPQEGWRWWCWSRSPGWHWRFPWQLVLCGADQLRGGHALDKVCVEASKSLEGGTGCCGFCRRLSMSRLTGSFVALGAGLVLMTRLFIFSS